MKQLREMLIFVATILEAIRVAALQDKQLPVIADCQKALGLIQSLDKSVSLDAKLLAQLHPLISRLSSLDRRLETALPQLAPFLGQGLAKSEERAFRALGQRLTAMRLFLDGESQGVNFGNVTANEKADLSIGIGLKLSDGSLQQFLSSLLQQTGASAEQFFAPFFDDDTSELLSAISNGQTALAQYLQSQLVLRYDPVLSKNSYDLSEAWRRKFQNLSSSRLAQEAQILTVAGARLDRTKYKARLSGIRSLRGFAMLFDLDEEAKAQSLDTASNRSEEQEKILSLSDEVLSRMHGKIATHWQSRLQSVFQGYGEVEGRLYDERRFLGHNAQFKLWEKDKLETLGADASLQPSIGEDYVIKPGDKLSSLIREVYQGKGDYRAVLRQNPHIDIQQALLPGTIIHFPDPLSKQRPSQNTTQLQPQIDEEGKIRLYDRNIEPLSPLNREEIQVFKEKLTQLSLRHLNSTIAVELSDDKLAILSENEAILVVSTENAKEAKKLYPAQPNPLLHWLKRIAAQIRGDIIICDQIQLPLGLLIGEPHRRHWLKNTLERFLQQEKTPSLSLFLHPSGAFVDIVDRFNNTLVRLENLDFLAIKNQCHRRLRDLNLHPLQMASLFSQLWASDLLSIPAEILVPPLSGNIDYTNEKYRTEQLFNAPMGSPVYPCARGQVVACGSFDWQGTGILLKHHDKLYSRYTHLATLNVSTGQIIEADTVLGRSGVSGELLQPALGFSLEQRKIDSDAWISPEVEPLNPQDYLSSLWPNSPRIEIILRDL